MAIKFIDLCSGIGGFHSGLTATGHYECVGHAEIDPHASKAYAAIYGKEGGLNYGDLRKIKPKKLPDFDLLCAGFPCQSFSVAGRRLGFKDTRGTIFFEIARIIAEKRPSFILLENVPGLLSHDGGRTLTTIFSSLVEMGYNLEWMVLNSKYFGVPQQRRRLYIVGYLDSRCAGKVFPLGSSNAKNLKQLIPGAQGQRVYETDGIACTQCAGAGGWGGRTGLYFIDMNINPKITDVARCMPDMDITLYLNELRMRALADALGNQTAETVEDKLTEAFDMLYQEYVPDEQRAAIEARIERENAAEQARLEAKRLFAVFHIRENGEDYHFTSDHFRTPMQAAYRYRLYDRGELSANPETLASAFIETNPISLKEFNEACTDINSDKRITALVEFDLDEGNVSICNSSDNAWSKRILL